MSTIKPRKIIQHPSTILKMKKKAIQKNNLNFFPLLVGNTHTKHYILPSKPSLSDSISSSDKQDLKNIDKSPYSAIHLSKLPHFSASNTSNPITQTKQIDKSKRKLPSFPASQSTSPTLNPKKKATPRSRLRKNRAFFYL